MVNVKNYFLLAINMIMKEHMIIAGALANGCVSSVVFR